MRVVWGRCRLAAWPPRLASILRLMRLRRSISPYIPQCVVSSSCIAFPVFSMSSWSLAKTYRASFVKCCLAGRPAVRCLSIPRVTKGQGGRLPIFAAPAFSGVVCHGDSSSDGTCSTAACSIPSSVIHPTISLHSDHHPNTFPLSDRWAPGRVLGTAALTIGAS
ncbi:hypothetical protein EV126DRAFT_430264 [Verticillium dahliae]|nr:hypothetical protein EV126DRAFT_430264 [Verticillium dahliae]